MMSKKYKRKESFRFVFNQPIDAEFSVLVNGRRIDSEMHPCKIIDISPRGMKVYTNSDISKMYNIPPESLQLQIHFVLDITRIQAIGYIRWCKLFGTGAHYGLQFENQPDIEELIISEMKRRRRKEVISKK